MLSCEWRPKRKFLFTLLPYYLVAEFFLVLCLHMCMHAHTYRVSMKWFVCRGLLLLPCCRNVSLALISDASNLKPHCSGVLKSTQKLFTSLLVFLNLATFCTAWFDSDIKIDVTQLKKSHQRWHVPSHLLHVLSNSYLNMQWNVFEGEHRFFKFKDFDIGLWKSLWLWCKISF